MTRLNVIFLLMLLNGCSTVEQTKTEFDSGRQFAPRMQFKTSSTNKPSSFFKHYFSQELCRMSLHFTMNKDIPDTEWNSYGEIKFIHASGSPSFSIFLLYDADQDTVITAVKHSKDKGAEVFGRTFSLGEKISVMVTREDAKNISISIEEESKMEALRQHISAKSQDSYSIDFEFKQANIGFEPASFRLVAAAADVDYTDIIVQDSCPST